MSRNSGRDLGYETEEKKQGGEASGNNKRMIFKGLAITTTN